MPAARIRSLLRPQMTDGVIIAVGAACSSAHQQHS
jgi:hypothetical protein